MIDSHQYSRRISFYECNDGMCLGNWSCLWNAFSYGNRIISLTCDMAKSHNCSPHNPTGKVFSREELLIIAQACQKMDCFAITDEVGL